MSSLPRGAELLSAGLEPKSPKNIDILERVQRRANKIINGLWYKTYEERLVETGLTTLVQRRKRGDLIETFKVVKGITKVNYTNFFKINENRGRGHMYKLTKDRSRLNIQSNFYSQKMGNSWNSLPNAVVGDVSVNSLKYRLEKVKY